jgi:hypothetical protein
MPSLNSWGKHGDEVLNTPGIVCTQICTGVGFGSLSDVEASGNIYFSNYFSNIYPKGFARGKKPVFNLLSAVFSPFSTPLIINETN